MHQDRASSSQQSQRRREETPNSPKAASAGRPPQGILDLQREIGNRGVVKLLSVGHTVEQRGGVGIGLVVQRKLNVTKKQLDALTTRLGAVRARLGDETTWSEITSYMERYQKAKDEQAEVRALFAVEMLAKEWLDQHGTSKDASDKQKAAILQTLVKECEGEIAALQPHFDAVYEAKLIDTNIKLGADTGKDPRYAKRRATAKERLGFAFISESATMDKTSTGDDGVSKINPGGTKIDQFDELRARPAVAGKGLTDAELAAIRVYSGGDYQTINPTLERKDDWLLGNVGQLTKETGSETKFAREDIRKGMAKAGGPTEKQRRRIKVDAMMHARMAVSGLKKLPDAVVDAYRGVTMPLEELIVDYKVGKRIVYKPFVSTSTKKSMSEGYASIPRAGKVGVLLTLKVTKGKDVTEISVAPKEGEVLLLPGAEFVVTEAPKLVNSLYYASLSQVDAGGHLAAPVLPAVPLNDLSSDQQLPSSSKVPGQPSASAAAAATPVPVLKSKASACAKDLIAKATAAEPKITSFLHQLCQREKGCRLEGLQHKFKTEGSLARKLEAKASTRVNRDGDDVDTALKKEVAAANDVLRYTIIAPLGTYKDVETRVRAALETKFKISNYWDAWTAANVKTYKGLNMGFTTSDGIIFEVQMHTDESFATKQLIHEEYEEARETGTSGERKKALENYMETKWKGVPVPVKKK